MKWESLCLQLQATLQRDSPEPEVSEKDDVDLLLDELVSLNSWFLDWKLFTLYKAISCFFNGGC